jgi:AcrR family transcriptional regulator
VRQGRLTCEEEHQLARVVKDPKERRIELLETAQKLFYELGYDKTSVQNIVDAVDIAKGTFYHYFHSKEDLLAQLAEWQADIALGRIEKQVDQMKGNAVEKFRNLISGILNWKIANKEMMFTYIRIMYSDENLLLRSKVNQIYIEKVLPVFAKVIRQGTKEGLFNVKSAEEASEIFLYMLTAMAERIAPIILSVNEHPEEISILIAKVKAFENALERVLGMMEGTLQIYDTEHIKKFFLGGEE